MLKTLFGPETTRTNVAFAFIGAIGAVVAALETLAEYKKSNNKEIDQ